MDNNWFSDIYLTVNKIDGVSAYSHIGYYPFGSPMATRAYSSGGYRFGFNGKEKDDEINVDGGSYDFGARIYDGRLGSF